MNLKSTVSSSLSVNLPKLQVGCVCIFAIFSVFLLDYPVGSLHGTLPNIALQV